jgi:hypothetical protein
MQQSKLSPSMLVSQPISPLISLSKSSAIERRAVETHIWKLLHLSDHPDSNWFEIEARLALSLQECEDTLGKKELVIGSPDWVFSCSTTLISGEVLTITRESHLIAQVQVQFNQLKLVSLRPLSARLLEALFELALDRRESLSMDEHFCKWADVVKWRLGLASLGYEFAFEKITDVSAPTTDLEVETKRQNSRDPLPGSRTAKQIQILYKYG